MSLSVCDKKNQGNAGFQSFGRGNILHKWVREQIVQDLLTRNIKPGKKYHTETDLAERFKVSRNTIRKAMTDLEREGFLCRRQRVGVIVGEKCLTSEPVSATESGSETSTFQEQRLIVILPLWDDSVEGFYAGKIIHLLVCPDPKYSWRIEIRHPRDMVKERYPRDLTILAIDPLAEMILHLKELSNLGSKILLLQPSQSLPWAVNVAPDFQSGVRESVKRFYSLGHRVVGLVNYVQNHDDFRRAFMGYLEAHQELQIPILPQAVSQMMSLGDRLVPNVEEVTAWISTYLGGNSLIAQQCQERNKRIPEDVSIVCLDDPLDEGVLQVGKRVSVVRPDVAATAATVRTCAANWNDNLRGKTLIIPMQTIDRDTVGPAHLKKL